MSTFVKLPPVKIYDQFASQSRGERDIQDKHSPYGDFHSTHQQMADRERLRKHLHSIQTMLYGEPDVNGDDNGDVKDGINKKINAHVRTSINTFKQQYGINDGQMDHVDNIVDTDHTLAAKGDIVLSGGIAVLYLFMNLLSDLANFKYIEMQQKAQVSRDAQNKANEVNEIIADVSKQKNSDTYTEPLPADVIKYMEDNDVKIDNKTIDQYLDDIHPASSINTSGAWYTADNGQKVWVFKSSHGQWEVANGSDEHAVHNGQKVNAPFVNKEGEIQFDFEIPSNKQSFQRDGRTGTNSSYTEKYEQDSGKIIQPGTQFYIKNPPDPDRSKIGLNKGQLSAVKSALENASNRASDFVSQSQLQLQKVMQTYNVTVSLINSMQTLLEEMNKSIAQNIR